MEMQTQETSKGKFSYAEWYQKNKERLSEKRARRYAEDPQYRAAALWRSRQQRLAKKKPIVDGHTVPFGKAAESLGVTIWVLREWRRKDYFPEPYRRDNRLWFTPDQVTLLRQLQDFFVTRGARVGENKRKDLETIVSLIYSNW